MDSKTCTCGRYPGGDLCPTPSRCGFGTTTSSRSIDLDWCSDAPSVTGHYWRFDMDEPPAFGVNPKVVFYAGPIQPLHHRSSLRWAGPFVSPSLPAVSKKD